MIELDTVFRKSESVVSRKIVDELILVPIRKSVADMESLFTLNDVGARIYELIDGKRSVGGICGTIVEEFEVSDAEARADVTEFLEKLKGLGGIEETPRGGP
jgi:hypothetical protein